MIKVLVTYRIPQCGFTDLPEDFEVIFPKEDQISEYELNQFLPSANAIVSVFGQKLTREVIDKAPYLKIIANFGVGYDNVDVDYATQKGITVTNTPDPVTESTAELAMGLMVAVARKIGSLNCQLRSKEGVLTGVMKNLSTTLYGKTVGIIGMGAIGKALARRAIAFGMKVVYYNRRQLTKETELQYNATYLPLHDLLEKSDVVSIHTPMTPETKHLLGKKQFAQMKSSAFVINTARGGVIQQEELIEALQNHEIRGAGLDVYANEPHIPEELLAMDNVVLTPHTGTATLETREEMSRTVSQNILEFFKGELTKNIVNS